MKQVESIFQFFKLYRNGCLFFEKCLDGQFKEVKADPNEFGLISDMIAEEELWYSENNIDFVKIVRDFNHKLVENYKLYKMFEYRTDGTFNFIYFNGTLLWSDEFTKVENEDALIEVLRKRYYDLRTEIFYFDM